MNAIYLSDFAPLCNEETKHIILLKRSYKKLYIFVTNENNKILDVDAVFRTLREIYSNDELVEILKYDYKLSYEDNIKRLKISDYDVISGLESFGLNNAPIFDLFYDQINENPTLYYTSINKFFKKFYTKNVLIYGTASTGKTTLTKDLANYFNTSYSLEYAREYQTEYNVLDDELDIRDLTNIGIGQFNQNKRHIHSPATNKIFFADTDVMTTLSYLEYYNGDDEDYESVKGIFEGLIKKQHWDLVLFLQPDTEYVNDGFRDMSHSNKEFRNKFNEIFKEKLNKYDIEFTSISGSYEKRFIDSIDLCEGLIK